MGLLAAALVTILVETAVFLTNREYRKWSFVIASVFINLSTNLTLNLGLRMLGPFNSPADLIIIELEALVWAIEFCEYGVLFRFSWKLLGFVCLANAVSYSLSFVYSYAM